MRFRFREPEYTHFTRHRRGTFGVEMEKRANLVLKGARKQVGVDTGALLRSLRVEFVRGAPANLLFRVGSDDWKAYLHHEGAKAHIIRPVRAKVLQFPGNSGTMVFKNETHMPALAPNRYLLNNLRLATM